MKERPLTVIKVAVHVPEVMLVLRLNVVVISALGGSFFGVTSVVE